jgi:hypothetical protein
LADIDHTTITGCVICRPSHFYGIEDKEIEREEP